ncbi:helix-turn-helix transcriptional regulator [Palleronia abyssalis]|mgnify:CR=1 FL=1|uniref:Exoenzyme S synthesis regulatory protein ExsA n=1 Tax=Palleronia abyssalis TaxID=1501240 RepID=A0A2R8BVW7_9RHOB|nr:AraC family transcriptional regulator [Palleronia abyssalis]SPJ24206.1 Exoenzyme S synthesis regulatory protein ExsA [Palleronia abyssalis]
MPMPIPNHATTYLIHGRRIAGDLRATVVGRAEAIPGRSYGALLLESGTARIDRPSGRDDLKGPALFWTHQAEDLRLSLAPGAVGTYVLIGRLPVRGAIGRRAEVLSETAERDVILPLVDCPDLLCDARDRLGALLEERRRQAVGSVIAIEAHLQLLLVALARAGDDHLKQGPRRAFEEEVFEQFTTLVDLHYRDRWKVQDYATALGVSRDRLGDICMRACGHAPKHVIARRTLVEARLMLSNSTQTVQQIADMLGFASASHFSRAFSREAGQPPGAYRAANRRPAGSQPKEAQLFAWP